MSSACDGDAIANRAAKKRRLRNRATGTLVFSLYRTFNRVAPTHRSQNLPLTGAHSARVSRDAATIAAASEAKRRVRVSSPRPLKRQAPAPSGGKIAPKPDKVVACVATRVHNFSGRESFLPGRQSAQERHAANRHGRCGEAAASYVQVCRRPVFPEYATARKRTAMKRLRQGLPSAAMARYDG